MLLHLIKVGQTLRQTAISVNIKERLDFSCALFSPDGGLVGNSPSIPVHLGSISAAVKYQVKYWEGNIKPGDVLLSNHPAAGGSHLPGVYLQHYFQIIQMLNSKLMFVCRYDGDHPGVR